MRLLLGFGNKARHGKDSAARAIAKYFFDRRQQAQRCYGYGVRIPEVKRMAFADALRRESSEAISRACGIERLLANGFRDDLTGNWIDFPSWVIPTPNPDKSDPLLPFGKHSKLLQWWGTEYRRNQDENYWVNVVAKAVADDDGIVLITDVRFPNEAAYVKSAGGFTINLTRLEEDGSVYVAPDRPKDHISEIALDGYNWDGFIRTKSGQEALAAEQAITLANFFYELTEKR